MRDRDGDPAAITGRNRLVADYLVEEVLNGLDDDTARFLEEASILEPMSAALLDDVLGRTDSGRQLAAVEATGNLFLIALDDDREWYRFHHLFGELLTSRLGRRDPARLRALHRRASEVLEAEGDLDRAIDHALSAGDRPRAAALVQREAVRSPSPVVPACSPVASPSSTSDPSRPPPTARWPWRGPPSPTATYTRIREAVAARHRRSITAARSPTAPMLGRRGTRTDRRHHRATAGSRG